jgi:hypothetical protein
MLFKLKKSTLLMCGVLFAGIAFAQNPELSAPGVNPSPGLVNGTVTMSTTFTNVSSVAYGYDPANPMIVSFTTSKFLPSNGTATAVSGPGSVYFTWSAQCTGGCGGATPTWIIIGVQNQVIPGSTGSGPFTVYAGGAISFSGTITAASTQAQAGANNGDGFNANITPSPSFTDIALGASNTQSAFGYTSGVVPVRLISFTAKKQGATALLNWATSMELNSSRFDVEKSADGHTFVKTGTVQAQGNSNAVTNYSFTDNTPFKGANYYRLKVIDIDGTYEYSDMKKLEFNTGSVEAVAYPNPVTNTLYIKNLHGNNVIELINTDGKIIKTVSASSSTKDIDMSTLAKGVYLLKITEGNALSTVIKVIKQ